MQRQPAWKLSLKVLGGLLAGLALWIGFSPFYRGAVMGPAELVLNLSESPDITELHPDEDRGIIVNRTDFPPESPRPGVALHDLTFNVILLFALFALSRPAFSNANIGGLGLALVALWLTHVIALVVHIKKIYALQLGPWSVANYGAFSRNFWGSLEHFYRIVGLYAIAFALWWLLRGENWANLRQRKRSRRKR